MQTNEQALHFNIETFSNSDRDILNSKSILKYEIKKNISRKIILKIDFVFTINKRRKLWDILQKEWILSNSKKLDWENNINRLSISNEINLTKAHLKNINDELTHIKSEIKSLNKKISKLC